MDLTPYYLNAIGNMLSSPRSNWGRLAKLSQQEADQISRDVWAKLNDAGIHLTMRHHQINRSRFTLREKYTAKIIAIVTRTVLHGVTANKPRFDQIVTSAIQSIANDIASELVMRRVLIREE